MNYHIKTVITKDIKKLEYNPQAQYTFNLWCMWFWFWNMPLIAVLLIWFNQFWMQISIFYVAEASVWALVATHFGAMSASLAAFQNPTSSDAPLVISQGPPGSITKEVKLNK